VNTFLPLIIPNFFSNAFNIFLIRQFVSRLSGRSMRPHDRRLGFFASSGASPCR